MIVVTPSSGSSLDVDVQGHHLVAGESVDDPRGPEPIALFVAGLASCVARYAVAYLHRHRLGTAGLAVTATYELGVRPNRIASISIGITPPHGLPVELRAPLMAMARHCTAHNTLVRPPPVDIHWETALVGSGDAAPSPAAAHP